MNTTFLTLVFIVLTPWLCVAQCDSLIQTATADSGYTIEPVMVDDALPATEFIESPDDYSSQFNFHYIADSSQSVWKFSEFLLNRKKLFLSNWCMSRVVNWDNSNDEPIADWSAAELRGRSTIRTFPIMGGDTVQFYRSLTWTDRLTGALSFNRYVNANGLSYSVELIQAVSGTRLLLLDTFNIAPTTTSRRPCIYSWYPMMSRVRSVVPSNQDSVSAYIRVNTWTSGASPQPFMRHDGYGKMISAQHLGSSTWTYYNDSVQANTDCTSSYTCEISAEPTSSPRGIMVSHPAPTTADVVAIVTISGAVLWQSSTPFSPVTFALPTAGLYVVVAYSSGSVLCTKKLYIP